MNSPQNFKTYHQYLFVAIECVGVEVDDLDC